MDFQVGYFSSLTAYQSPPEIGAMLRDSRRFNQTQDITGILLIDRLSIVQILEGPRAAVSALYNKIALDSRHTAITQVIARTVGRREFPESPLAYFNFMELSTLRIDGLDRFLRKAFDLSCLPPKDVLELASLVNRPADCAMDYQAEATISIDHHVQIMVRCPRCIVPTVMEIPALVLAVGLSHWRRLRLHCDIHDQSWDASDDEMRSLKESLQRMWVDTFGLAPSTNDE